MALRDSGVDFIAADMPEANTFTVGIMALLAQQERELISTRTKAALAELKAKGKKLGNNNITAAARQKSIQGEETAATVLPRQRRSHSRSKLPSGRLDVAADRRRARTRQAQLRGMDTQHTPTTVSGFSTWRTGRPRGARPSRGPYPAGVVRPPRLSITACPRREEAKIGQEWCAG